MENMIKEEKIDHPSYYKGDGFECIDEARFHDFDTGNSIKYLWRMGDKQEEGMTSREKEIEDLKKTIWYVIDKLNSLKNNQHRKPNEHFLQTKPTHIREALKLLWDCGVINKPLDKEEEISKLSEALEHLTQHLSVLEVSNKWQNNQ